MKRLTIIVAFVACGFFGAYAQSSSVTLQNQEDATFYYVLDPQDLQGLSAGSRLLATKVAAFFAEAKTDPPLQSIAPNAEAQLDEISDGTHLLVGVFAQEGENDLPVRVFSIEADSKAGDRFYALFATPAQLTVTRAVGRLASLAPAAATSQVASTQVAQTAANSSAPSPTTTTTTTNTTTTTTTTTASSAQSADASSAPTSAAAAAPASQATAAAPASAAAATTQTADTTAVTAPATTTSVALAAPKLGQIASFASYDPIIFTREAQGDFSVLPIADSRGWPLTGTRITALFGVIDATGLHVALSVPEGFSESVSYFFYVFAARTAGQTNDLTLEIQPRAEGSRGACLAWQKGSNEPRLIGAVQSTPTRIELDISADDLSAALAGIASDTLSVDVTSGWYDRALGTWEEFYYTTISANQIPVIR